MEHVNRGQREWSIISNRSVIPLKVFLQGSLTFWKVYQSHHLTWDLSCEHQSRRQEWSWLLRGESTIERALLGNCEIDDRVEELHILVRGSVGKIWRKQNQTFSASFWLFPLPHLHLLFSAKCWQHSEEKFSGLHSRGLEGWREGWVRIFSGTGAFVISICRVKLLVGEYQLTCR